MAACAHAIIRGSFGMGAVILPCAKSQPALVGTATRIQQFQRPAMLAKGSDSFIIEDAASADGIIEGRRQETLFKTRYLVTSRKGWRRDFSVISPNR